MKPALIPHDTEMVGLNTPLYHYTSLEVFERMMDSRKMRASHVAYMNDGSELEFAFNLLTQQLRERLKYRQLVEPGTC